LAARKGHRVTVVERDGPERFTTSFVNAGLITPSHIVPLAAPGMVAMGLRYMRDPESPFYVRPRLDLDLARWGYRFWRSGTSAHVERAAPLLRDLNLASRALYADLAREDDRFGLRLDGGLMLTNTEHGLREEAHAAALARSLGLDADVLSAEEVRRLEPGIRLDVTGGVFYAQDAWLDPGRFMVALARLVEEAGVTLRWHTEATGWRRSGDRLTALTTSGGDVEGDAFVAAGGAWTADLVRRLGLRLPLQAGKGYHLRLDRPPAMPRHSYILMEGRVAVTPMGESVRFAGTMEIAGLDTAVNPARIRGIVRSAGRYLPEFTPAVFEQAPAWVGLRPCTPDGLPYIGPTQRVPNLIVATGHAMMGLSLAPVTGRLVAELLSGDTPSLPLDLLAPERFERRAAHAARAAT
jgi:D-amino-acid dehydrogenase